MTAEDRDTADSPAPDRRDAERAVQPEGHCWSCGAALPEGAMFCGECGSAVGARAPRQTGPAGSAEGSEEDAAAEPVAGPDESGTPSHGDALIETAAATTDGGSAEASVRGPDEDDAHHSGDQDESGTPPHGDAVLAPSEEPGEAPVAGNPESPAVAPEGDSAPTAVHPALGDAGDAPPHGDPVATGAAGSAADEPEDDAADPLAPLTAEERLAAERLLDPESDANRFVLQFSTGESATVYGSGLIGRNPVPEPGEYVDQLVVLRDPGRSVSKTHLEFGQDGGAFWVLDRFSGNGSVLREPEAPPRRCEPGRRYVVARGTRIEIGDQFFVVS